MSRIRPVFMVLMGLCCCAFSETTLLQGLNTSFMISEGGGVLTLPTKIISNQNVLNENPLPSGIISREDYESRFFSIIPIESTMIIDTFYWYDLNGNLIEQGPVVRPFIDKIDKFALINLTDFIWDGTGLAQLFTGYSIPSASGLFNQAEQKFYVSDGRQYQVVPEPSALSLLAVGLGGLAMIRRRRS